MMATKLSSFSPTSRTIVTTSVEHAVKELKNAINGEFDAVWVAGGDGSLFLAANMLAQSQVSLGVIPFGTVNALAKSLKIPLNPLQALNALIDFGEPFPFDVGIVNGQHYFLCFGSVGFDAVVVKNVRLSEKQKWGRVAYVIQGIRELLKSHHKTDFELRYADESNQENDNKKAHSVIFSNIKNYAGLQLFPAASPNDQLFEMLIIRHWNFWEIFKWFAGIVVFRKLYHSSAVENQRMRTLFINGKEDLIIQLDGDSVKLQTPQSIEVSCIPGGLNFWGLNGNVKV